MKGIFTVLALLLVLGLPSLAQSGYPSTDRDRDYAGQWQGRISSDDQKEFNEHYKEWQEANAKNDRHDIDKHARKMSEIMARYNIPRDTPFDAVATSGGNSLHYDLREYQGRFSPDDQKKFDKAYEEWMEHRGKGDRHETAEEEGKMQELMARYNIPRDLPYDALASGARGH